MIVVKSGVDSHLAMMSVMEGYSRWNAISCLVWKLWSVDDHGSKKMD